MDAEVKIAFVTVPSRETANEISQTVISERLAACVNEIGPVKSTFSWEGKVSVEEEYLLVVKLAALNTEAFQERVLSLHPYDVPEIIFVDVSAGLPDYLKWVLRAD
ncbi:divalent-cation tolerance protein CutA [bacterium]|nr:divalent-cation tolerance protein CutA [bacterium]